jgi:hypothetical protein
MESLVKVGQFLYGRHARRARAGLRPIALDRLLSDLATLARGQSHGDVIHVASQRPEAVEAVVAWCSANGYAVLSRDSAMMRAQSACFETFTVEAWRIDRPPLEQALALRDRAFG